MQAKSLHKLYLTIPLHADPLMQSFAEYRSNPGGLLKPLIASRLADGPRPLFFGICFLRSVFCTYPLNMYLLYACAYPFNH